MVRKDKESKGDTVDMMKGCKGDEKEVEKVARKKRRKPLDKCRNLEYIAEETRKISETVRSEATELGVTEVQLLSYLLYRVSYQNNRNLAKKMFHMFRSGEWQPGLEPVGVEKALALTERSWQEWLPLRAPSTQATRSPDALLSRGGRAASPELPCAQALQ